MTTPVFTYLAIWLMLFTLALVITGVMWRSEIFSIIADALIARAKRTPYYHLPGYMNRWWLIPYSRWLPAVRVHEILRSDDDRAFHDHPWAYISVILKGRYFEITPELDESDLPIEGRTYTRMFRAGNVIFRRANSWHKLIIPPGEVTTTLFITFKKVQRWGFLTSAGKIVHDQYLHHFNEVNAAYREHHPEQV